MKEKLTKIVVIIISIIVLLSYSIITFAHSGKTDPFGGHYDSSTGEYHYHHGYDAHQHPNGNCPYENSTAESYTESTETLSTDENGDLSHSSDFTTAIKSKSHTSENRIVKKLIIYLIVAIPLYGYVIYRLIRHTNDL